MLFLWALAASPALASAQSAEPVQTGAPSGFELTLTGATSARRGHSLTLSGIGHVVEGLAQLQPRRGLVVDVEITARRGSGQTRRVAARASATTEAGGRFRVAIAVPDEALSAPRLELIVRARTGQPGRRFQFALSVRQDEALDLLTDRNRYQPGETVRAWLRVRSTRSRAPLAGRNVTLRLQDRSGLPLATVEAQTGASGVVTADLTMPDAAETGAYRVTAETSDGTRAERAVQVWRRTVERILAEIEVRGRDEEGVALVAPGARLRGRVVARTPSGTPIRGATVELRVSSEETPTTLSTDAEGIATFEIRAPTFLSGDVGSGTVTARVVHAAHGTITTSARFLIARVRAVVSVTPRGGAIVPEVEQTLTLSVSDPRGRPIAAGTEVRVAAPGIAGGQTVLTLDDGGFADVTIRLPRGAASRMQGGSCNGQVATTLDVQVRTSPPRDVRVCARVSPRAEVAPIVRGAPIRSPGSTLDVAVRRRPSARGRAVLLEAMFDGRAVASTWVDGRANTGSIIVPSALSGVLTIRARAARAANASEPPSERGANMFGVGAFDAVLVQAADAFALQVAPAQERYLVRERASVSLTASTQVGQAWAALLVRDQAAHGGEGDWELHTLSQQLREAALQPASENGARLIRAALSASISLDSEGFAPGPLETPYWRSNRNSGTYGAGRQTGRGVLRDPTALREEMLRRGLARFETVLERAVLSTAQNPQARANIVSTRGGRAAFHPDVIQHLISTRAMNHRSARTLGGEPITVAMIEAADAGFSFNTVAARLARQQLSRLLLALLRLSDPDNTHAQRASANLPPERWLGTLVQLGVVRAADLTDPWGHAFSFRRVTGRPTVAVSERALDWELASPGPDGRIGSADDVRDPFGRAVPQGTPYAVSSGEEALMQRLSALAPSQTVLTRMNRAYDRLALAAQEEQRSSVVTASRSEGSDEDFDSLAEAEEEPNEPLSELDELAGDEVGASFGFAGLGLRGTGRGGGGSGEGPGALPASAAPSPTPGQGLMERGRRSSRDRPNRPQAMGAMIREDFPATLFFVGEVPLVNNTATIEVPLADALTTYRLEAIAWSSTGWTTSGDARLRVDQDALIDAPVPPFATVGDRLRLPVRVENRTDAPLSARVLVESDGELALSGIEPVEVEVPPRSAREVLVGITMASEGSGDVVVSLGRQGGGGLDAVRRSIQVLANARTARDRRTVLVDGETSIVIEVPERASERGPASLRLSIGPRLFGDPAASGRPLWAAWAVAMTGEALDEALAHEVLPHLVYEDHDTESYRSALPTAIALGAAWQNEALTDADAARALRGISAGLPAEEVLRTMAHDAVGSGPAWMLLGLAPVAQALGHRPLLRADAERVIDILRQLTSNNAAQATDAPTTWAHAAAALALAAGSDEGSEARAREMVRRTERYVITVGDIAWVEPESSSAHEPRAEPTALFALARGALGERAEALRLVRALIEMHRGGTAPPILMADARIAPPAFQDTALPLAAAAAGRLAPSGGTAEGIQVTLDGQRVETTAQGASSVAELGSLGRPGEHTVRIFLPSGGIALAQLNVRYGMPWDAEVRRRAPIDLTIDGELGARDTRSAIQLRVQNRSARILTLPIIELELPAGSELDEPTREALAGLLVAPPRQDGRTLILPLRPLAPGGWVRLPLPIRWAVAGELIGLGAVAYDALGPEIADVLPIAMLAPRTVELADEGPEPEPPDPEASPPPSALPPPMPVLDRLVPTEGGS